LSPAPTRPSLAAYGCLALSMSLVGSYVALSKPLAAVFPVLLLAWLRFGIGGVAMLHWLRKPADEPPLTGRMRGLLFLESFLGNFLFTLCMISGVKLTTAVSAGVIMAAIPAAVAVLSWLFLRERVAPRVWVGVACAVLGIALVSLSKQELSPHATQALDSSSSSDLRWLGKIRQIAAARYRDDHAGPDVRDASDKVRKLIDEAIVADGVQILIERVSLFSADFEKKLGALRTDEARASEIEHAIRHEIHVKLDEDPAFYQSLREQLEQIIEDGKQRRIDAVQQLSLLQKLTDTLRGRAKIASEHGLSDVGFAIYGLLNGVGLADGNAPVDAHGGDRVRDVAQAISLALQPHTGLLDWRDKGEVQREMRRTIKRLLPTEIFAKDSHERIAEAIVSLLKAQRA
jgi:hypothetical protein